MVIRYYHNIFPFKYKEDKFAGDYEQNREKSETTKQT